MAWLTLHMWLLLLGAFVLGIWTGRRFLSDRATADNAEGSRTDIATAQAPADPPASARPVPFMRDLEANTATKLPDGEPETKAPTSTVDGPPTEATPAEDPAPTPQIKPAPAPAPVSEPVKPDDVDLSSLDDDPDPENPSIPAPSPAAGASADAKETIADDDDLQKIKGIGAVLEQKLKALGVRRFDQIAAWTDADVERINDQINFPGRIEREAWVEQAKALSVKK